ncbi:fimbrial protein [Diaphorobacter aerolatus]|uniref:fimbrial protein n=1 Tax=Diaphorobacter aerolatus TaxID=1288495 RepID=UPI001D010AB8|nr:fimbrial protein [Diaphorobacter aerolatus]
MTSYQQVGGKIQIRLSDVPPLQAQLYKMSDDLPALDNPFNGCSGLGTQGMGIPVGNGTVYACWRPNAYIQLRGGGIASDSMGQDSFDNQQGVDNSNGFAYGMWNTSTLTSSATCRVNSSTSNVSFAPISVQELEQGGVRQGTFSVQLECSNAATSGTAQGQTSIGIQASSGAIAAAQQLGLTGSSGSVPFLVSDAYLTDSRLAKGVGISLAHSQTRKPLVFLGENLTDPPGQNTNTGWYPVLEGASNSGASPTPGYTYYLQNYTATLSKIPGLTVTAGKVLATAYVQVRVQ